MKEVFVVMQGQYSDRHIEAIFDTEENAQKYVRSHLKPKWDSPCYVEKWEVNPSVYGQKVQDVEIEYNPENNTIVRVDPESYHISDGMWGVEGFVFSISSKSIPLLYYIKTGNTDNLLKVAQDRYAEYKARKENIT